MTTIAAALQSARQIIQIREARRLLQHVLACPAAHVEAHRDDELPAPAAEMFNALVLRRSRGEPIAYLTGTREFYGRQFAVDPGVLIPRHETELIVDTVLSRFGPNAALRLLDLGTGCGCLAITLALELPHSDVTAVDVSRDALVIAQKNAQQLGAKVRFQQADWFASLAGEQFDLIVSNPPYIAAGDPHLTQGDLRFEPPGALASGADGLEAIRHIAQQAPVHLRSGGWLLFEHGYDQGEAVRTLLDHHGYCAVAQFEDLAGIRRITGGYVPSS